MQINYKSTGDNKCETTRAKNTIERKVSQSSKNTMTKQLECQEKANTENKPRNSGKN